MLGQRFGAKRVVLVGLVLMALGGVVMGSSASFAAAAPARLALSLVRREWLLVPTAGAMWGLYNVAYIVFAAAMVLLCMLALALFRAVAPTKET